MHESPESAPKLKKWKDHELDIFYLIYEADDCIVFLDSAIDVDWLTTDEHREPTVAETPQRNQILNRAASLECIPNSHHKITVRTNFKRMVGEGVARALSHDYDSASTMLDQAKLYIEDRNVEQARYWQLSTGCTLGLLFALLGVLAWSVRTYLMEVWSTPVFFLILSGGAGALGAVLSMIFRMGSTFPTSEAPQSLHRLEAASRVFAGLLSGLMITSAIRSGLVLPILAKSEQMQTALLVAAMVSGASERWAPSLIAQIEKTSHEVTPGKKKKNT